MSHRISLFMPSVLPGRMFALEIKTSGGQRGVRGVDHYTLQAPNMSFEDIMV